MKGTYQILFNLYFVFFIIIILSACKRRDDPVIKANNWQTIYQNSDLDLFSIKFLDKNNGYVLAGLSAVHTSPNWELILSTTDGGNNWIADTCVFPTINDLDTDIFPLGKGIILGIGSHVYRSDDNGKTWLDLTPQFVYGARINDLYFIDTSTWLIAQGVNIFRTTDAGQTWQAVFHTDFMGAFAHFSFPSPNIGYISTGVVDIDHGVSAGLIIKTIDGGQTWTTLTSEPWKSSGINLPALVAMQFINDIDGFISTFENYKLYKTIDGGNNWSIVPNNKTINSLMYFVDEKAGYYSDGYTIYITNDGGKTWKIDNYNNSPNSDILVWTFLYNGQGYALTRDHRIIKNMN